jgi:hypothetical protein
VETGLVLRIHEIVYKLEHSMFLTKHQRAELLEELRKVQKSLVAYRKAISEYNKPKY